MLNENLSWKSHTSKIGTKISKHIGVLNKLKNILPVNVLRMLYCSLILPHLTYSILTWGFDKGRLTKLQKKAVRIITSSKFNSHTEPIFKNLRLLKLDDIFTVNLLKFYYKLEKKNLPKYFQQSFNVIPQSNIHDHNTRGNSIIASNVTNTESAQKCLRNELPRTISNTDYMILTKIHTHSPNGFSNYIKDFFVKKYSLVCNIQDCYTCSRV